MSLLLLFGGSAAPPPITDESPDWGQSSIGPRGFLGIPPRRFRANNNFADTAPTSTEARFTQAGLEAWSQFNPTVRFTQVGLEIWYETNPQLRKLVNVYFL